LTYTLLIAICGTQHLIHGYECCDASCIDLYVYQTQIKIHINEGYAKEIPERSFSSDMINRAHDGVYLEPTVEKYVGTNMDCYVRINKLNESQSKLNVLVRDVLA
jgi:hypothetical protein